MHQYLAASSNSLGPTGFAVGLIVLGIALVAANFFGKKPAKAWSVIVGLVVAVLGVLALMGGGH